MLGRTVLFVLALLFVIPSLHAQKNEDGNLLSRADYQYLLRSNFSQLIGEQQVNSLFGNYAAVNIKDAEATFGASFWVGEQSMIGLEVSGGAAGGVLSILDGDDLNGKVSFNAQYNRIIGKPKIANEESSIYAFNQTKRAMHEKFLKDSLNVENDELLFKTQKEIKAKQKAIDDNNKKIKSIEDKQAAGFYQTAFELDKLKHARKIEGLKKKLKKLRAEQTALTEKSSKEEEQILLRHRIDSLGFAISANQNLLAEMKPKDEIEELTNLQQQSELLELELSLLKAKLAATPSKIILRGRLRTTYKKAKRDLKYDKKKFLIDTRGIKVNWISLNAGFSNRSFKLFDGSLDFNQQIVSDNYTGFSGKFQYSHYNIRQQQGPSYYLSIGVNLSFEDNLGDLGKVVLKGRQNFGEQADDRYSESSVTAYQGTYRKDISTLTLFANYYQFLTKKNNIALHFYPELRSKTDREAAFNFGTGFLFVLNNKESKSPSDQSKSPINAEIFYILNDLANANNSEEKLFGRGVLGLQFSFPINIKSKEYATQTATD